MNLIDKIKKTSARLVLGAALLLPSCAIREGDNRVSFFAIPFIGVAATVEKYKTGTNDLDEKVEIFATGFGYNMKRYGENGKYLGRYEVRVNNNFGEVNIITKAYNEKGVLIHEGSGLPEGIEGHMLPER